MPELQGSNIRDHFQALGSQTAEPYLSMAKAFAAAQLPPMPERWEMSRSGWTKYTSDGGMEAVSDLGDETTVSFDVETLYKLSSYPCMATAVTPNGWYSWLCPTLFETPPATSPQERPPWDTSTPAQHPHDLIPLFPPGSDVPRLVIGHNVGYDRARIFEEYDLKRTSTRWLDTLSFHVATRGITSVQRPIWMKHRKSQKEKLDQETDAIEFLKEQAELKGDMAMLDSLADSAAEIESMQKRWEDVTAMNSLAEVANLHCGIPVDKSIRNRFGDESITHASQIVPELHDLLTYCGGDVKVTHDVYVKVLPLFLDSCPHPASFAGVLAMGSSFLPVNGSWQEYLESAETKYREMNQRVKTALRVLAEKVRKGGKQEGDAWSQQLDWTPKTARWSDDFDPTAATEGASPAGTYSIESTTSTETSSETSSEIVESQSNSMSDTKTKSKPAWLAPLLADRGELLSNTSQRYLLPLLLRLTYKSHPIAFLADQYWCFRVPHSQIATYVDAHGPPVDLSAKDHKLEPYLEEYTFFRISGPDEARKVKLTGVGVKKMVRNGELKSEGYQDLLEKGVGKMDPVEVERWWRCAEDMEARGESDPWGSQLDWARVGATDSSVSQAKSRSKSTKSAMAKVKVTETWPKWYWDLTVAPTNDRVAFGELDLTTKKSVAPLLLRLQWQGYPLFFSREHKWLYRVPNHVHSTEKADGIESRGRPVKFDSSQKGDEDLFLDTDHVYFRLPHKDGEGNNVGNPLSKSFVKAIETGELSSAAAEDGDKAAAQAAHDATQMNVLCSYWMSSRERIMDQMVVYRDGDRSKGMILPQVITMGTVTRRAVEATWLTASNAKKNRVGSELKAMVRAPPGYSIVGADVDSEELWISSVMGDSQFGMHGATAIGWMTLEGTKSAGTDLHSKTASILGISRDAAKVFNYSRIYGAGQKHAVQLLLQGDSTLTKDKAQARAMALYGATKGSRSFRAKSKRPAALSQIWHGGSESYLFNTLEAIALSDRPTTPALGCGVTRALRKTYLEDASSYLPSRINWVVQSSGVDYLHLLIVSMEYLIKKYNINARYLLSVHDEVRYLATESDRYRTALALQIANAWTRCLFSFNLGIDNLPQGVTFFSAVDIDHVLRKEVFMTCETPSHPRPIPQGESLDIEQILAKTNGGRLGESQITSDKDKDEGKYDNKQREGVIPSDDNSTLGEVGRVTKSGGDQGPPVVLFTDLTSQSHQEFLYAQAQAGGTPAKRWLDSQAPLDPEAEWTPPPPSAPRRSRSKVSSAIKRPVAVDLAASSFKSAPKSKSKSTSKPSTLSDPKVKMDGKTKAKGKGKTVTSATATVMELDLEPDLTAERWDEDMYAAAHSIDNSSAGVQKEHRGRVDVEEKEEEEEAMASTG